MGRELFPVKHSGDSLTAAHINDLSDVARRFAGLRGGGSHINQSKSTVSVITPLPWQQHPVEVHSDEGNGDYYVKIRYLDWQDTAWKSNEDHRWPVNILFMGNEFFLLPEDRFLAYWDDSRNLYLPINPPIRRLGVLAEDASPNSSAQVTIWRNGVATEKVITGYLDWLYTEDGLTSGQRVILQYYQDRNDGEGQWVIEVPWC